jgi:hypothetical protein
MVLPPDEMPCVARLVNLQTLTVTVTPVVSSHLMRYWNYFLDMLKTIPSRHLRRATYVTSMPPDDAPAGDADRRWKRTEPIVTERVWAEGEPGAAKVTLQLWSRTHEELRSADVLVRDLRERPRPLFTDGWMDVSIM